MNDNGEKPITSKDYVKEFDQCPACGSKDRFFEGIVKELKERGIVGQDFNFFLDMKQGVVANPQMMEKLPLGAEVPGYMFTTDICSNCGAIYAIKLQRITAKKSLVPAQIIVPNRADRRRIERQGIPPSFNNPRLS